MRHISSVVFQDFDPSSRQGDIDFRDVFPRKMQPTKPAAPLGCGPNPKLQAALDTLLQGAPSESCPKYA